MTSTTHHEAQAQTSQVRSLARDSRAIEAWRWLAVVNIVAAGFFVIGCIGFYWPAWYVASVTMFLVGSVLFLLSALATALVPRPGAAQPGKSPLRSGGPW
jgi:hypothetical protein